MISFWCWEVAVRKQAKTSTSNWEVHQLYSPTRYVLVVCVWLLLRARLEICSANKTTIGKINPRPHLENAVEKKMIRFREGGYFAHQAAQCLLSYYTWRNFTTAIINWNSPINVKRDRPNREKKTKEGREHWLANFTLWLLRSLLF